MTPDATMNGRELTAAKTYCLLLEARHPPLRTRIAARPGGVPMRHRHPCFPAIGSPKAGRGKFPSWYLCRSVGESRHTGLVKPDTAFLGTGTIWRLYIQVDRRASKVSWWRKLLRSPNQFEDPTVAAVYFLRLRAIALALRGPSEMARSRIAGGHRPPLQRVKFVYFSDHRHL